jgi:hypothetical protein
MKNNLFHRSKGTLTPAGKKFSPLHGMQELYADEKGKKHILDGSEITVDEIVKTHKEIKDENEQSEKEKQIQDVQDDMEFEKNLSEYDQKEADKEDNDAKHSDVLSEIKNASEAIVEAVEAIPEMTIPEFPDHYKEQAIWQEKVLNALKLEFPETDMKPLITAIKAIKFPEFPTPINYTAILQDIKNSLPKERDNSDIIEAISKIQFPEMEHPPFKFNKKGNLVVALEEMAVGGGGGGSTVGLATEETLQSIAGQDWDTLGTSYPDTVTEVYTYYKSAVLIETITVVYTDAAKTLILSVSKA